MGGDDDDRLSAAGGGVVACCIIITSRLPIVLMSWVSNSSSTTTFEDLSARAIAWVAAAAEPLVSVEGNGGSATTLNTYWIPGIPMF